MKKWSKKDKINYKKTKSQYDKKYRKKNQILIKKKVNDYRKKCLWLTIYVNIGQRCNNPNHNSYKNYGGRGIQRLITSVELKELWFRDKAYLMKKPSIDRIDNNGHYEYDNCRFIELSENTRKNKKKPILQFDLNGNFIREWESLNDVGQFYKVGVSSISKVLTKNRKTCRGFIWRYKND